MENACVENLSLYPVHCPLTMCWARLPKKPKSICICGRGTHKSRPHFMLMEGGAVEVKGEGRWHRKITNFTCRCTQKTQELQIINVTL